MGLHQDAVDVVGADGFGVVAGGFEHGGDAEVAHAAQDAVGGAGDQLDGPFGEGVVGQPDAVELGADEAGDVVGRQGLVGDECEGDRTRPMSSPSSWR